MCGQLGRRGRLFWKGNLFGQMNLVITVAARVVEVDVVVIAGPDGPQTDLSRPLDGELVTAQLPLFDEGRLPQLCLCLEQILFLAQLRADERLQIVEVANGRHVVTHSVFSTGSRKGIGVAVANLRSVAATPSNRHHRRAQHDATRRTNRFQRNFSGLDESELQTELLPFRPAQRSENTCGETVVPLAVILCGTFSEFSSCATKRTHMACNRKRYSPTLKEPHRASDCLGPTD